jgi:hypothetical protein
MEGSFLKHGSPIYRSMRPKSISVGMLELSIVYRLLIVRENAVRIWNSDWQYGVNHFEELSDLVQLVR